LIETSSLFDGESFVSKELNWYNCKGFCKTYETTQSNRTRWLRTAKERGFEIRRARIKTPDRPKIGEVFYCREDFERAFPSLKKKRIYKEKRESYGVKSARVKPDDLTEPEYNLFVLLVRHAIQGKPQPGLKELSEQTGIRYDTIRFQMRKLIKRGYLQRRVNERCNTREYRFLKGPNGLLRAVSEVDPKLIFPFEEGADK
jgi:DNA-binding MarR family transcriptional regulator